MTKVIKFILLVLMIQNMCMFNPHNPALFAAPSGLEDEVAQAFGFCPWPQYPYMADMEMDQAVQFAHQQSMYAANYGYFDPSATSDIMHGTITQADFYNEIRRLCSKIITKTTDRRGILKCLKQFFNSCRLDRIDECALSGLVSNKCFIFSALGVLYANPEYRSAARGIFGIMKSEDLQSLAHGYELFEQIRLGNVGANFDNIKELFRMTERIGLNKASILQNSHFVQKAGLTPFADMRDHPDLIQAIHELADKILNDLQEKIHTRRFNLRSLAFKELLVIDIALQNQCQGIAERLEGILPNTDLQTMLSFYGPFRTEQGVPRSSELRDLMIRHIAARRIGILRENADHGEQGIV